MSYWVCCNSCFLLPSPERKLAVTTCGHVICSVCYQKGKQGKCLICSTQCQVSPLSDKSSSDVKALFSDINVVATKHLTEISKVLTFQARHQKRLLTYYQQRNGKLEEFFVKMKQERQQMTKKLHEQSAYIAKLETSLQHQCSKPSLSSQTGRSSHPPHGQQPVLQIPYNSPSSLARCSSTTNMTEGMEVDERSLFRKPNSAPRMSIIKLPQEERMGTIPHRSSSQILPSAHSASVSRFQMTPVTPESPYAQSSVWTSPVFRPPSSFRHSMSSLLGPPP
ncbi:probable E3 SUMO-protein ligase RNF212 [Nematolebias whitei]|uniref:probable E3 SUMO-protein ligase RNF212 n=1 Tax=Nematolebias whitei TaxID=451745 RepID=UPI00189B45F5|nr:probable E3 SUMO-protein ligase RNF212 [Nematolebias whitei]